MARSSAMLASRLSCVASGHAPNRVKAYAPRRPLSSARSGGASARGGVQIEEVGGAPRSRLPMALAAPPRPWLRKPTRAVASVESAVPMPRGAAKGPRRERVLAEFGAVVDGAHHRRGAGVAVSLRLEPSAPRLVAALRHRRLPCGNLQDRRPGLREDARVRTRAALGRISEVQVELPIHVSDGGFGGGDHDRMVRREYEELVRPVAAHHRRRVRRNPAAQRRAELLVEVGVHAAHLPQVQQPKQVSALRADAQRAVGAPLVGRPVIAHEIRRSAVVEEGVLVFRVQVHQLLMSCLLRSRDAPKSTPVCTMRRGMRCDVLAGSHGGRQP